MPARLSVVSGETRPGAHGFLYDAGTYTIIDVPGATSTVCDGINDAGQMVGHFSDGTRMRGFLYAAGSFTIIDVPGSLWTAATQASMTPARLSAFIVMAISASMAFFTMPAPSPSLMCPVAETFAEGINDAGQIVGYSAESGTRTRLDAAVWVGLGGDLGLRLAETSLGVTRERAKVAAAVRALAGSV